MRTPGACVVKDDMQGIFRALVASDLLVLATPVRFGSYCAQLKKVVDRFQPLMVPIYTVRDDEMHFRGRYDLPALLGVGLVREREDEARVGARATGPDGSGAADEAEAFRFLVGRLAVNIDTRYAAAAFAGGDEAAARTELERALATLEAVRTPSPGRPRERPRHRRQPAAEVQHRRHRPRSCGSADRRRRRGRAVARAEVERGAGGDGRGAGQAGRGGRRRPRRAHLPRRAAGRHPAAARGRVGAARGACRARAALLRHRPLRVPGADPAARRAAHACSCSPRRWAGAGWAASASAAPRRSTAALSRRRACSPGSCARCCRWSPPTSPPAASSRPQTVRLADKSPFPLPRGMLIALINSRTRKAARSKRLDLDERVVRSRLTRQSRSAWAEAMRPRTRARMPNSKSAPVATPVHEGVRRTSPGTGSGQPVSRRSARRRPCRARAPHSGPTGRRS